MDRLLACEHANNDVIKLLSNHDGVEMIYKASSDAAMT